MTSGVSHSVRQGVHHGDQPQVQDGAGGGVPGPGQEEMSPNYKVTTDQNIAAVN